MRNRVWLELLFFLVLAAYVNTLPNGFTTDDELYVLTNPQVTHLSLRGIFSPHSISNVFRPISFGTLALNWAVGGANPFGYHAVNLLLHAAVTMLFFALLQALFGTSPQASAFAFAAAALFAVHPLHTEAVNLAVGRAELLAAGFLLCAWILHLREQEIPALLCFSLAVLSKESAVAFFPLVLLGDYAVGRWKPLSRYARIAGLTLLYLGLLWKVQGGRFGQASISLLDNPLASIPAGWRILNALRVAWKYVGLHFYPATLSCDYSFNQIPVYLSWRHTLPAAVAAAAVIAVLVLAAQKGKREFVLAGGIYLAAFATTANILIPTGTIMGERLAYLPSAGFCLLVGLGWSWLRGRKQTLAWGLLAVVLAAFAIRTGVRNLDWRDDVTLFLSAAKAAPNSAKVHANLGAKLMDFRLLGPAQTELQAALRINPNYPDALASYGLLQAWLGDNQSAGQMLESALKMSRRNNPHYDYMAVNLAGVWMQAGRTEGALDLLNREIAESPQYARAWSNRAVIRYQRGDFGPARSDAEAALRLDRDNTQAQNLIHLLDAATPAAARQSKTRSAR